MRLVTLLWLLSTAPAFAQPRFDPEAETDAYLARVSEEDRERSDAYFEGGYWLQLLGYLYTLGIAWFLLASRLSARMRDWAVKRAGSGFFAGALYMVQYGVATFVLGFPLTLYQGFIREHRYGLANQSFGPWMRDQLVALGVGLLVFSVAVACLYVAIRKAGRRWWLWGAVGAVVFMSLLFLIGPVFIAPLFNPVRASRPPGDHRADSEPGSRQQRARGGCLSVRRLAPVEAHQRQRQRLSRDHAHLSE